MFTVQIFERSTGKPVSYKRVAVGYNGWDGGLTKELHTDSNGEAHFDYRNGDGTIYVDGQPEYEGMIEGRKVLYI